MDKFILLLQQLRRLRMACLVIFLLPGYVKGSDQSRFMDCIDSIRISVTPVHCFGLRNGVIHIDSVYGGVEPIYYSIDGYTYSTRPEFDRLWAGFYTVWIRDALGCERQQQVEVPEPEEIRVVIKASDTLLSAGAALELQLDIVPQTAEIQSVSWRPPDLFDQPDQSQQSVVILEATTIAVEVRTTTGCVARDQIAIRIRPNQVYFPNAIKPGSNQDAWFTVFSDESLEKVVQLTIYSRNGGMVFERRNFEPNNPLKGWNGKIGTQYAPAGVYTWTALLEFEGGRQERRSGSVAVVR